MDKLDNRHRLSAVEGVATPTRTYHDTMNDSKQGAGRKLRTKKKVKKNSSQILQNNDWSNEHVSEFQHPGSCWMPQGQQRLFTAISDPAVCGYPMSLGCPVEQFSLPMIPVYHASPVPQKISYKPSVPVLRKQTGSRNHIQESQGTDQYASLPPGNLTDFESDHQRRFSDPGLANGPLSDEDRESDDESGSLLSDDSQLADRLSHVMKDNKRLETELQDTKLELQEIKLEITEMKQLRSSYEPGLVSDLVREVREAMKLHQEVYLSKVQRSNLPNASDRITLKDYEEIKRKMQEVTNDRDMLLERLTRLEEQVKTVMVHNCVQKSNQEELVVLENEKMQLRRELQEAVEGRKAAEAKVQNFEQLMNIIQKKIPNGLTVDEKTVNGEREVERLGFVSGGGTGVGNGGGPPSSASS